VVGGGGQIVVSHVHRLCRRDFASPIPPRQQAEGVSFIILYLSVSLHILANSSAFIH
jgi:hypothetical protein